MTMLYPNLCYNEVCYKGTALYNYALNCICYGNIVIFHYSLTHLGVFFSMEHVQCVEKI